MHDHRARESYRLTGQHWSHIVSDEVHDTSIARFGGSVILKDTDSSHHGIISIHHIVFAVPIPPPHSRTAFAFIPPKLLTSQLAQFVSACTELSLP